MLESELTHSLLVPKLPQSLLLAVCKFCAASKERCKQGYRWVCVKLCCWAPETHQNDHSNVHDPELRAELLSILYTRNKHGGQLHGGSQKPQNCQNLGGGTFRDNTVMHTVIICSQLCMHALGVSSKS